MSLQFKGGPEAVIHLDANGRPHSVEINGFKIPGLIAFNYTVRVREVDELSVTFYVNRVETKVDLPSLSWDQEKTAVDGGSRS